MIYDSPLWSGDIDLILRELPELDELAGRSVLITGAAGLICSTVTDVFIRYNETHALPIRVIAAGRSAERMEHRFGAYWDRDYFAFVPFDAAESGDVSIREYADYIIHGAGSASPKKIVAAPVETMLANFNGLYRLLSYGRDTGAARLLYISSSEVYGRKADSLPYSEGDYGYIDLLNMRNSYSVGKRAAETLCASFQAEYGLPSVIVRPGHVYGPTASADDDRISSAFAHAAARGEKLVMKSAGTQLRSYCHCLDCASAIIKVLLRGTTGQAYNISDDKCFATVRRMAEAMAEAGGVELVTQDASEQEIRSFNPMECSALKGEKLERLGWHSLFGLRQGAYETVRVLRERENI